MKSAKVRFLIASLLALLLYGAEAYAKDATQNPGRGFAGITLSTASAPVHCFSLRTGV
jgi:hypothetical protein